MFFCLTMDLLDVDNQTPSGKILPVLLQVLRILRIPLAA